MTVLKRVFVVCVSTAILGTQLWSILPPRGGGWKDWYWPFIRYPMYNVANYPGDVVGSYRLTGSPCTAGPDLEIGNRGLHLHFWVYRDRLRWAAAQESADPKLSSVDVEASERNAALLTELVRMHAPEPVCTLTVWEQAVVLGQAGSPYDTPWERIRSWRVDAYEGDAP